MTLYAGIDGGQSNTVAVIADETGKIFGRGVGGPSDEIGQSADSTRLHDALRDALADALTRAGLPQDTRFDAIVAGISGYEGHVHGRAPELPTNALTLVHDSENAHAGALGGGPGVVAIAGTGSIAFARNGGGAGVLVGGWGFLFGDEGSAFWLARIALADAMRDSDAGVTNEFGRRALEYFQLPSLRNISRGFYLNRISRAQLASFATVIVEAAERGNEPAARYLQEGAGALATLVMHAMERAGMQTANVAFTGGMTQNATYLDEIARQLKRVVPQAHLVPPRYDSAVGSLILAYKHSTASVPERIA